VLFAVDVAILVALAVATLVTLQAGWHIHAGVLRGLLLLLQLLALSAVTPVVSPGAAWVGRVFAFVAKGPQNAFVVLCAFGVHHPHERVLAVVWSVCVIAPATATLAALAVALRAVVGVDAVHLHTVCSLERLHRAYVAPPRVVRFDDVLRVLFQRAAACAIVVVAPVHRLAALRMARSALTPADGARGAQMVDAGALLRGHEVAKTPALLAQFVVAQGADEHADGAQPAYLSATMAALASGRLEVDARDAPDAPADAAPARARKGRNGASSSAHRAHGVDGGCGVNAAKVLFTTTLPAATALRDVDAAYAADSTEGDSASLHPLGTFCEAAAGLAAATQLVCGEASALDDGPQVPVRAAVWWRERARTALGAVVWGLDAGG
jgi:hypothetical protein